jgi:hypothetical protein
MASCSVAVKRIVADTGVHTIHKMLSFTNRVAMLYQRRPVSLRQWNA